MTNNDMNIQVTTHRTPAATALSGEARSAASALSRGLAHRCPACGAGNLYTGYLKVADTCQQCNEELHHHRADDAPPYFTIFIVGHLILGGVLALEQAYAPAPWVHAALWLPLTLLMSLLLLPRIKGALVGLQWALRMHGFADEHHRTSDTAETTTG
jgi:uncharacterized protein (DUF983 family)